MCVVASIFRSCWSPHVLFGHRASFCPVCWFTPCPLILPHLWVPYQQVAFRNFSIKNQQLLPSFSIVLRSFSIVFPHLLPQFTPSRAVAEATVAPKWQLPGRGEAQVWQAPPEW